MNAFEIAREKVSAALAAARNKISASSHDAPLDLKTMHDAIYDTFDFILGGAVVIEHSYANVSAPTDQDDVGNPVEPYLVLPKIPATSRSTGRSDVRPWKEDSPGSLEGTSQAREDFEAEFDVHQVGGNGEILQKLRAAMELDNVVAFMANLGLAHHRTGDTVPAYVQTDKTWGPDAVASFVFSGAFVLDEQFVKTTDVQYTLNTQ